MKAYGFAYRLGGKRHGPGGIGCACCNAYHCHPRNSKHLERRVTRRKLRQNLKRECENVASYRSVS